MRALSSFNRITPCVAILNEMAALKDMLNASSSDLKSTLRQELNLRGIGGETFQANAILDNVKKVHEKMESILNGTTSISRRSGPSNLNDGLAPSVVITEPTVPILVDTSSDESGDETDADGYGVGKRKMYCWGGRLHNVPEHFVLPRMTLQTLIIYWFCGSRQPHCPPLKYVKHQDFPGKEKNMRIVLNQMKRMIKEVIRAGHKVGFFYGGGNRLNLNSTVRTA